MKGSTQAALTLGVGYVLGRRRKLRTATLMAGGMAVGAVGGLGSMALRRGAKVLSNTEVLGKVSPQLGEIADTVRNDLLDAGKAAAVAAVSSRIDSLTGTLHDRAETLRNPSAAAGEAGRAAKGAADGVGKASQRLRRRGRAAEDDEAVGAEDEERAPLDEDDELRGEDEGRRRDEDDEPRDEDEPRRRRADVEDDYDEAYEADDEAEADDLADAEDEAEPVDEDEAEPVDEDEPEPADEDEPPARPRRSRSTRTRSPVSRTRR